MKFTSFTSIVKCKSLQILLSLVLILLVLPSPGNCRKRFLKSNTHEPKSFILSSVGEIAELTCFQECKNKALTSEVWKSPHHENFFQCVCKHDDKMEFKRVKVNVYTDQILTDKSYKEQITNYDQIKKDHKLVDPKISRAPFRKQCSKLCETSETVRIIPVYVKDINELVCRCGGALTDSFYILKGLSVMRYFKDLYQDDRLREIEKQINKATVDWA